MGTLRHSWEVRVAEARAIQEALRDRVEERNRIGPVRRVAGADVSYDRGSPILSAALMVLDADSLQVVDSAWCCGWRSAGVGPSRCALPTKR